MFNDVTEIAELIKVFEEENQNEFLKDRINGWLPWSVIRKPLYFLMKNQQVKKRQGFSTTLKSKAFRLNLAQAISQLFLLIALRRKYQDKVLIMIHEKYEVSGMFRLLEKSIDSSRFEKILTSSTTKKNHGILNLGDLVELAVKTFKLLQYKRKIIKALAHRYTALLRNNSSYRCNHPIEISPFKLQAILIQFLAKERLYQNIFRLLRPRAIIVVDELGSGLMAAAIRRRIPIYEFQHGFFSMHKPDYYIPPFLSHYKDCLICPTRIVVFGQAFKDALLTYKFWQENQICILGSATLEGNQTNSIDQEGEVANSDKILLVTQPSCSQEWKSICSSLSSLEIKDKCQFHIKVHPNESNSMLDWYKELGESKASFTIHEKETSIYDLFLSCSLVCGFHSTALLEALALEKNVIIFKTENHIKHSFMNFLRDHPKAASLRPIEISDQIINSIAQPESLDKNLLAPKEIGSYFFSKSYKNNLSQFLAEIGSK